MPVLGIRTVQNGGGMFQAGGVLDDLKVLGLREDEIERESSGTGADILASSSLLNFHAIVQIWPSRAETHGFRG